MGYIDMGAIDARSAVNTITVSSNLARRLAKDAAVADAKRRAMEKQGTPVADDGGFMPGMPAAIADAGTGTKLAVVGGAAVLGIGVMLAITRKRKNPGRPRRRRRSRR